MAATVASRFIPNKRSPCDQKSFGVVAYASGRYGSFVRGGRFDRRPERADANDPEHDGKLVQGRKPQDEAFRRRLD